MIDAVEIILFLLIRGGFMNVFHETGAIEKGGETFPGGEIVNCFLSAMGTLGFLTPAGSICRSLTLMNEGLKSGGNLFIHY